MSWIKVANSYCYWVDDLNGEWKPIDSNTDTNILINGSVDLSKVGYLTYLNKKNSFTIQKIGCLIFSDVPNTIKAQLIITNEQSKKTYTSKETTINNLMVWDKASDGYNSSIYPKFGNSTDYYIIEQGQKITGNKNDYTFFEFNEIVDIFINTEYTFKIKYITANNNTAKYIY
jgi:hypothetical protein